MVKTPHHFYDLKNSKVKIRLLCLISTERSRSVGRSYCRHKMKSTDWRRGNTTPKKHPTTANVSKHLVAIFEVVENNIKVFA